MPEIWDKWQSMHKKEGFLKVWSKSSKKGYEQGLLIKSCLFENLRKQNHVKFISLGKDWELACFWNHSIIYWWDILFEGF